MELARFHRPVEEAETWRVISEPIFQPDVGVPVCPHCLGIFLRSAHSPAASTTRFLKKTGELELPVERRSPT